MDYIASISPEHRSDLNVLKGFLTSLWPSFTGWPLIRIGGEEMELIYFLIA